MRIRQVRPEFFTDSTIAALSPAVRLTYIGLWVVADDAGWLRWDVPQIGAVLYPFESVRHREKNLASAKEALEGAGRLILHDCGCAQIPTLPRHQRISGKQSFSAREAHGKHRPLSDSPVTVGNGRERNGTVDARESAEETGGLKSRLGDYSEIVKATA